MTKKLVLDCGHEVDLSKDRCWTKTSIEVEITIGGIVVVFSVEATPKKPVTGDVIQKINEWMKAALTSYVPS